MRRAPVLSLVVVAMLAATCSDDDGSGGRTWERCAESSEAVPHPTGETDVVLRIGVVGGLPLPAPMPDELPQLTLYGDGRLLAVDGTLDRLVPALVERRLTEDEMQEVLHAAEGACLLERDAFLEIPESYDVPGVAFVTNADGTSHLTTAVGLGWSDLDSAVPASQVDQRQALLAVHSKTAELIESGASAVQVERLGAFVVDADGPPSDDTWPVVAWPLEERLAAFGHQVGAEQLGVRCAVVSGDDIEALLATVEGLAWGQQPLWTDDDRWYQVSLRPMLPDELRCGTLVG